MSKPKLKTKTGQIIQRLRKEYPDARCALVFENPYQLLVATILSAQCTDAMVNKVTPALFARYPRPEDLAQASEAEVQRIIRPTGFFRQKSKSLIGSAQELVAGFGGEVPSTLEELTRLRGVARKTANVVISNCFPENISGIAVDTHVRRLTRRLGLTEETDPERIERDLMELAPRGDWGDFTYLMIEHGRHVCTARKPNCAGCVLNDVCPSAFKVL